MPETGEAGEDEPAEPEDETVGSPDAASASTEEAVQSVTSLVRNGARYYNTVFFGQIEHQTTTKTNATRVAFTVYYPDEQAPEKLIYDRVVLFVNPGNKKEEGYLKTLLRLQKHTEQKNKAAVPLTLTGTWRIGTSQGHGGKELPYKDISLASLTIKGKKPRAKRTVGQVIASEAKTKGTN